jgi:hypothetical protein
METQEKKPKEIAYAVIIAGPPEEGEISFPIVYYKDVCLEAGNLYHFSDFDDMRSFVHIECQNILPQTKVYQYEWDLDQGRTKYIKLDAEKLSKR